MEGIGPLRGLVVVDTTQFLAGPYATQLLADLGARVIKVEPPGGDVSRTIPPHFVEGDSVYYLSVNRNKESIALDLKSDAGRQAFCALAAEADVVIESNRPGIADRLGIGYEQLAKINPRIVLVSLSGFGQDGPYRDRPAYDAIVQALSGVMSITGEPGHPPVRTGVPLGDVACGLFATIGCLAAVHEAGRTGVGQHIDVSMLDSQVALLSYLGVYYLFAGEVPGPQGRGHVSIPTYRAFECADGLIFVTAVTNRMWESLCAALGRNDLVSDPRFDSPTTRLEHKEDLWLELDAVFRQRDVAEWIDILLNHDVPAAPINTVDKALVDPQVRHRNMVRTAGRPGGHLVALLGNPIKSVGQPERELEWPPALGEHTEALLGEFLGLTEAEVDELERLGAAFRGARSLPVSEQREEP